MDIKIKKGLLVFFIAVVVMAAGGLALKYIAGYYIRHITYNGRVYKISNQTMDEDLKNVLAEAAPTGLYSKGMEVYAVQSNPVPIIIFLKTQSGEFLAYILSGGP